MCRLPKHYWGYAVVAISQRGQRLQYIQMGLWWRHRGLGAAWKWLAGPRTCIRYRPCMEPCLRCSCGGRGRSGATADLLLGGPNKDNAGIHTARKGKDVKDICRRLPRRQVIRRAALASLSPRWCVRQHRLHYTEAASGRRLGKPS